MGDDTPAPQTVAPLSSSKPSIGQLACIIDRDPRTVMYNENDGQHPSLNTFYQMVTMFDISVDQFFYPDKGAAIALGRIDVMLSSMDEKDGRLVETIIRAIKDAKALQNGGSVRKPTPVRFCAILG